MAQVKVGGIWLRSIGNTAALRFSSRWGTGPCGSDVASCTVAVTPTSDSPLLQINQPFQVWDRGRLLFGGFTTEPGSGFPWVLNAKGVARRSEDFFALDAEYNPTTNPRTAVTQAIARGLPWSNPEAFPDEELGDGSDVPTMQKLDSLLDSWAVTAEMRWGTDDYGVAFTAVDPTDPSWHLNASDLAIGVATNGLATRDFARYVSSVDGGGNPDGWATEPGDDVDAQALYGVIEDSMDLTRLGYLTGGAATAADYASAQLALLTVPRWKNRVVTYSGRLRTPSGHGAHLRSVRAGQVAHLLRSPNSLGGVRRGFGRDVVLGEVEHDMDNPTEVTLSPVALAVGNIADLSSQSRRASARSSSPDWSLASTVNP